MQLNQGIGVAVMCWAACKCWLCSLQVWPCECLRQRTWWTTGWPWALELLSSRCTTDLHQHTLWVALGSHLLQCTALPLHWGSQAALSVSAQLWNPSVTLLSQFSGTAPPSHLQQLLPRMVKAVQSVSSLWPSPNYQENVLKNSAWVVCRWLMDSRVQKKCQ